MGMDLPSSLANRPDATASDATHRRDAEKPRLLLPALLTAGLLWMCYFPVGWGFAGWVALVPFLCLVRSPASPWRVYGNAWLCGLAFYLPILYWLSLADDRVYDLFIPFRAGILTWLALAIYCSWFFPLGLCLLRRLDRVRWPLVVALPAAWTSVEFVRAHVGTGFPWYFLGHTQHAFLPLIQIADLGGAYAVTALLAAANAALFEGLYALPWFRTFFALPAVAPRRPAVQALAALLLVAASLVYGMVRLAQEDFQEGPLLALVQGNLPQSLRNAASFTGEEKDEAAQSATDHYRRLSDQAAASNPSLIVWPETSLPEGWGETPDGAPDLESRRMADFALQRWRTSVLLGTNSFIQTVDDHMILYNSAVLLTPEQHPFRGRYDKVHRVPFGEYVPLRDSLSFLSAFAPYEFDYSVRPGNELTRFPLGEHRFGVLICFEDTDPYLARQYVRSGVAPADRLTRWLAHGMYSHLPAAPAGEPPADFLVNISNDAWFVGSSEHDQHLSICRFRAVECRRSIARSVNMGISAMIDGSGRIVALPGPTWPASKQVAAVLTAPIPLDQRRSLYVLWGDWLPALCCLMAAVACVTRPRRMRGERQGQCAVAARSIQPGQRQL